MKINLEAIREDNQIEVLITLTFVNVIDTGYEVKGRTKISNSHGEEAVIIHFGDQSGTDLMVGGGGFSLPPQSFEIAPEIQKIRVFFWNDNEAGSLDSEIIEEFITFFEVCRLDPTCPTGIIVLKKKTDSHIIRPREIGNGGVVDIFIR